MARGRIQRKSPYVPDRLRIRRLLRLAAPVYAVPTTGFRWSRTQDGQAFHEGHSQKENQHVPDPSSHRLTGDGRRSTPGRLPTGRGLGAALTLEAIKCPGDQTVNFPVGQTGRGRGVFWLCWAHEDSG
ncbi:MAG: hypothetical protein ACI80V_001402 [Rhodothermales bacterium]|jgi:hypothetical protein